jgi:lipoate-protein ligase A
MNHLIDNNDINDPGLNLALEEYCLRHLNSRHTYLLFYINDPSVVIGRHQNVLEEIDPGFIKDNGIHVLRRISGGGAVYHDHGNLNFSIIQNYDRQSLTGIKQTIGPVVAALRRMGLEAEISKRNDIVVGAKKISGNAQFSNTRRIVIHGTLLFDTDLNALGHALTPRAGGITSQAPKSIRSAVANISDFPGQPADMQHFKHRLVGLIADEIGGLDTYRLSGEVWDRIYHLYKQKYASWEWTYGKSPPFEVHKKSRLPGGCLETWITVKKGCIRHIRIQGGVRAGALLKKIRSRLTGIRYSGDTIRNALAGFKADMRPHAVEQLVKHLY